VNLAQIHSAVPKIFHTQTKLERAKDVLPNIKCKQPAEITPPVATEWSHLLAHDVICSERIPFRRCRGVMGAHSAFFVPGDLDL